MFFPSKEAYSTNMSKLEHPLALRETVQSTSTIVDLGSKADLQPLFAKLPNSHYEQLCYYTDSRTKSQLSYSALVCSPESQFNSFGVSGYVFFKSQHRAPNQQQYKDLLSAFANSLQEHRQPEFDIYSSPESDDVLFVRLSPTMYAKVGINDKDSDRYDCFQFHILGHEEFCNQMKVNIPGSTSTGTLSDERYDALKQAAQIWAYMHDAVAEKFDAHLPPIERNLKIKPPQKDIYMPQDEIVSEKELLFKDIAGYDATKQALLDLALMNEHPELAEHIGLESTHGILLHGPPGTGKTSLIKAFANEIGAELVELPVSKIVDMWVGKSAKNMDEFFDNVRRGRHKIVVMMDEFDSLGTSEQYASSGERIDTVNRLKEHIIDIGTNYPHIILTGATNRLHRVDDGLLRPGRFQVIEVGTPDIEGRRAILSLMLGKLGARAVIGSSERPDLPALDIAADIDVAELAKAGSGLTGAHFNEILNDIRRERLRGFLRTKEMPPITQNELIERIKQAERSL